MAAAAAAKQVSKAGAKKASKEAAKQADKAKEEAFRDQKLLPGQAKTGTRAAKDTKEPTEYTPEVSGRMRFRRQDEDVVPEDRTPRMSDDYKKGGAVSRVYTAEMGQPPSEDDMSATPKPAPKPAPAASAPKRKDKPVKYPKDVPVDEPTKMAKGGAVSSASKRADGCAQRGKTRA